MDSAVFAGEILLEMIGLDEALGQLVLIGQAIAGAVRQSSISKKQADFTAPVLQKFGTISDDIMRGVDDIYAQITKRSLNTLDELYSIYE